MKKIFLSSLFLIILNITKAHPGIGIVKDSKGNIYYTDLQQVWKITADGKRSVAVSGVHTHELYIDANDELYGEHLWYNGERLNTWGHYVWCLKNDGKLIKVTGPNEGFLTNYSFTRDRSGNMYWVDRSVMSSFKMKTKDGRISTIAEGKFSDIRWMHVAHGGTVYFTDLTDLYKIEKGKFILLAKNLEERTSVFEYTSLKHNVFGIWLDKNDNVYVAVFGGQVVKKITRDKKVSDYVYSTGSWRPSGGVFDDEGNLWLLENDPLNAVRVRKIVQTEFGKPLSATALFLRKAMPFITLAGTIIFIGLPLFFLSRKMLRKKTGAPGRLMMVQYLA